MILLVLLFIGFKDQILKSACECEEKPVNDENEINLPERGIVAQTETAEIDVEKYERENDQNVMNLSDSKLQKQYFRHSDMLKLRQTTL